MGRAVAICDGSGAFLRCIHLRSRQGFKEWRANIVPQPIERSTYVLFTNFMLILLFWQWRPLTDIFFKAEVVSIQT